MPLSLEEYTEEYREAVLLCLRKNFKWLNNLNDEKLNKWFDKIVKYEWIEKDDIKQLPYYHGAVVLDENRKVVGFLGIIYAKRNIEQKNLIELNTTTWVIDEEKRDIFFLMNVCSGLYKKGLYITDFSAIPAMQKLNERFKINCIDKQSYFCLRRLLKKNNKLKYEICTHEFVFDDTVVEKEYRDHEKYGIKCIKVFSNDIESQYIFYHLVHRMVLGMKFKWIQILKISDEIFFYEHFENIVNLITEIEKVIVLQCDSHFLKCEPRYGGWIRKKEISIMAKSENISDLSKVDYLYTELCMVDMYAGSDITLKKIINKIVNRIS